MTKTITRTEWKSWKLVCEPTSTCGMLRKDNSGKIWVWIHGGKRVTVKKF